MTFGTKSRKTPAAKYTCSRGFPSWLHDHHVSLAFSTRQLGKLFFVGLQPDGRLSVNERTFDRATGLCIRHDDVRTTLWLASLYQIWRFENVLKNDRDHSGFDALFVPQVGFTTGNLDVEAMDTDAAGRILFISRLFSCLATTTESHNFAPLWKPAFISNYAAEDRCHLSGMTTAEGRPIFVTAAAASNTARGWYDQRLNGGIVINCQNDEIVASGLSLPCAPRLYRNTLWLLNAGSADFGRVSLETGAFENLTRCPGLLSGLSFFEDFAIVTTSVPSDSSPLADLPVETQNSNCQLSIIDLRTFEIVHWLRFEGLIHELHDVVALPGMIRPMALGFESSEIHRTLSIDETRTR
ncbi:MAG: TIGR03032 family protein [Planctomycetaceae bacterium]|nr:TIGR03032 family protein [Planctomycetaceae bacterium]